MTLKQIAHRGSGALIGLVILAIALSGLAIRVISFGGPLQRANQLQSDLVADILPPPEYIIEPFMETTVMVEDQSLPGHVEALATLRKAYEERKAYWHTADISDVLKAQLAVTNKSADAFWADADALVSAAQSGDWVGAKQIHDTRVTPAYTAHKADILKLVALADQEKQALDKRSSWLLYLCFGVLSVSAGVIIAGLILGAKYLRTRVIMPIDETADEMRQMAAGNYNITISGDGRADEIGLMAHAMKTFRAAGIAKAEADAKQQHVVLELGEGLEQLASGNLVHRIDRPFSDEYEALRTVFNRTIAELEIILSKVTEASTNVDTGATEINAAADDLSRRTEQQAASLEETSAAISTVTSMAKEMAQARTGVSAAIDMAHREARDGGMIVQQAVTAMSEIETSSQQISQIISVIDGIAFQTNLLALNAGVEAARAGDAGKGFAVVANEVRALAQRSADAARDIKDLITTSGHHVESGVSLVGQTGEMLGRIVTKVGEVNDLISSMASSTETQAQTMAQVNGTVNEMDKMTQQNAAMVEETTAASRSLANEAQGLRQLVSRFRLSQQAAPARLSIQASNAHASRPISVATAGNLALAPDVDDWSNF